MRKAQKFKNDLKEFLFWMGPPSFAGTIGQLLGYNFVYVGIITGVVIWCILISRRVQDLERKVFGRKKNGN